MAGGAGQLAPSSACLTIVAQPALITGMSVSAVLFCTEEGSSNGFLQARNRNFLDGFLESDDRRRGAVSLAGGPRLDHFGPCDAAGGKGGTTDFKTPARRCGWHRDRYGPHGGSTGLRLLPRWPCRPHKCRPTPHALVRELPIRQYPAVPTCEEHGRGACSGRERRRRQTGTG